MSHIDSRAALLPQLRFTTTAPVWSPAPSRQCQHAVPPPPITGWSGAAKRGIDVAVALVGLIVLLLLLVPIAIAIKLDSRGPVLFRQRRIGLAGRPFQLIKFRTMRHRPAPPGRLQQTSPCDPRVTRIGALLRRTSLDELPQLWNVLRGDMSLVGPRPHAPGTCAGGRPFERVSPRYTLRHRVRPGMTGLAQVRGWRGQTDTEEKLLRRLDSDLEYIATWSLWRDATILARTVATVLRARNAY